MLEITGFINALGKFYLSRTFINRDTITYRWFYKITNFLMVVFFLKKSYNYSLFVLKEI